MFRQQAENEDYDGDDTMVGAEELQLLQQMSAQMIQVRCSAQFCCAANVIAESSQQCY